MTSAPLLDKLPLYYGLQVTEAVESMEGSVMKHVLYGIFVASFIACGVSLSGCGKTSIKGLEICKISAAVGGASCASSTGVTVLTYEQLEGYTCTNAVGTTALLKQSGMSSEEEALKQLGLKTE